MKKLTIAILLFVLVLALTFNVNAANSLAFTPSPNTRQLKQGEELTITLILSNINMGEDGIYTFGGKLNYDSNVFEKVTESNFSSQNNWSIAYNSEGTDKDGTFLATINTGATTDQVIGTIKLKVKAGVASTSTTISFTSLSSVADDTVTLGDKSIQVTIEGDGTGSGGNGGNGSGGSGSGSSGQDDPNGSGNGGNGSGSGSQSGDGSQDGQNGGQSGGQNGQGGSGSNGSGSQNGGSNGSGTGNGSANGGANGGTNGSANGGNGSNVQPGINGGSSTGTSNSGLTNSSKIPQTGEESYYIIAAITVFAVLGVVTFILYKRMKID